MDNRERKKEKGEYIAIKSKLIKEKIDDKLQLKQKRKITKYGYERTKKKK